MIRFYYHPSPNPAKVALFLEESGLSYELVPIDIRRGEQFDPTFLAVNPNAKVPVLADGDAVIFDSNAILLYLAEKTGSFLSEDTPAARGQMLSWLMFVATGLGPFSGQAIHFRHYAPERIAYATNRYLYEAERHYRVLEARLVSNRYVLGDRYTIVDMAVWGWLRSGPFILGDDVWETFPCLKRLLDEISARPAAVRASALKERHAFKTVIDDEALRCLYPQRVGPIDASRLQA